MLFTDWYCPAFDLEVDRDAFRSAWEAALTPVETDSLPRVTVLRDFHAENIMLVDGQGGIAHYGLLDFPDALEIGSASCGERVCQSVWISVGAVSLNNKKKDNT